MLKILFSNFKTPSRTLVTLVIALFEISICIFFLCSSSVILSNSTNLNKYGSIGYESVPDYLQQPDSNKTSEAYEEQVTSHVLLAGSEQTVEKEKVTVESAVYSPQKTIEPIKGEEKLIYKFPIAWGDKTKQELSLTFDDGYDAKAIEKTLEVLDKYGIKSTFFVIGTQLRAHPDLWKKAISEGHQICNHTNNHVMLSNLSDEQIKKEISGWEQAVSDVLGKEYLQKMKKDFPLLRMPGGDGCRSNRILKIVKDMGYTNIWWSDETCYSVLRFYNLNKDPLDPIAQKVSKHVVDNASNGSIILLHFNAYDTERLSDTIDGIIKKGLSIKPLTDILEPEK